MGPVGRNRCQAVLSLFPPVAAAWPQSPFDHSPTL